ncbi:peptidoglycan DD-metalloendopeptidase family protein [Streptomyces sp. NPDC055085]
MSKGRHAKPVQSNTTKRIAIGATVLVGGSVVPVALAGNANAATVAQWDRIAQCESSGQWNLPYGDADSTGGLQIQDRTWADFGGTSIAAHAYQATKQQQIMIAEKILASQGPGAWTCNAIAGSPLTSRNDSVLLGGPNPYPTTSTPPSAPTAPTTPPTPPPTTGGTYTVKTGDYLVKIAANQHITGGWKALYAANKTVIGANPNLIHAGMKLVLPGNTDPYKTGLPHPGHTVPSAVALQAELKRVGYMPSTVVSNPNYGPQTQKAVAAFHNDQPTYRSKGRTSDPVIGPKGWAHLHTMATGAGTTGSATPGGGTSTPASADYVRPVPGAVIQAFHNPDAGYGLGWHTGVDLAGAQGTPVKAAHGGTVIIGGAGAAYGNHVVINHGGGVYTLYAHLSAINVTAGQTVSAGQAIGAVGSTGNSSGPHLHFELRNSPDQYAAGVFSDPVAWLRSHGVNI